MKCLNCKKEIEQAVHFCPWCGAILRQREILPMERLNLIIMRADLSGFTKMSENMIAEDVMAFLNEVFGVFTKIIESYKGIIFQVIGDEIVSIYGFPKESGFTPHMAIFAAEDMIKKLDELNQKEYLKNPVGLKIGMALEAASIFNIQDNLRNSLIITKGFKKCQILQKNADENSLLVCDNLYQVTKAFFSYNEIGEFVKDALTVKAYEYKIGVE
jgi:class 3 adenylate cyclase